MVHGKTKPLRIAALAIDHRMLKTLELFFRETCRQKYVLAEEKSADVALIDMDAYQARKSWNQHHKHYSDRPVITLALDEVEPEYGIFVRKPIRSRHLIAALDKVSEQIRTIVPEPVRRLDSPPENPSTVGLTITTATNQTAYQKSVITVNGENAVAGQLDDTNLKDLIGTMADIDIHDNEQAIKAQYDPSRFLQSSIAKAAALAVEKKCTVRLETAFSPITIFSRGYLAKVEDSDTKLRFVSLVPIAGAQARCIPVDNDETELHEMVGVQPVDALLWKVAVWTARGRVPLGTDFERPVYLRHWPNMTRLMATPHALRIAALWTNAPHSLIETARILKIPQRYVFAFYSAALAVGLAGPVQQAKIKPEVLVQRTQQGNHGVFMRILNRLRR